MVRALVFWNSVLNFSLCGIKSGIVEWSVILLCMQVERALILWNFVFYFSAFGTRFGIVESCVIFFCVLDTPWYCAISCDIFLNLEHALVFRNLCYIFHRSSETRSGIVKCYVLFSVYWMWSGNVENLCYSFLYVERALVFWIL